MLGTGWFSAIDEDASTDFQWQPCLQLEGWGPTLDVWFASKEECDRFIAGDVIGKGWHPGEPG